MTESDNQTALPAGTRVQVYEIIRELGRGGFGITYLALDSVRNRPVVLKEYFPSHAAIRGAAQTRVSLLSSNKQQDFDEGLRRFIREAKILSEFKHPNIVEVIALFEDQGTAYFVMEYIDGQSLQSLLEERQRPFTEAEIHKDLLPVLNGLAALHAKDLLHLDIKPDNILTSKYGQPLLIDFGGARYATSQASQDHSSMVFTAGYAPPEQYTRKQEQSPATDIYALGMTLYHLMAPTAELPDAQDRQTALMEDMPDPLVSIRSLGGNYSTALVNTVEACTEIRKTRRPQTLEEVRQLLGPLTNIDRTPPPAPEPPTPIPTPEPEKSQSERVSQPTPAPINSGHSEPANKKSPWLAIVAALVLLVGGVLGYQQYQIQQEELRQAERKEQERLAKLEAESKAKEAAARKAEQERQARAERERKFREGYTVNVGGVRFRMRGIPSGSFDMGSNNGEIDEKPVHRVSISSFYMMEHEVTFDLWDACVSDGQCERPKDEGWGRGTRPIINVSWNDITKQFIPWLNRKTGKTFRLPSESEWEYAARAGTTTQYSWGDSIDCSKARYGYYSDECGKQKSTDPVKSFSPNAFGLYDMHGNVWEWTQDCWNGNYNGAPGNNRAWESGDCDGRVLRGGSWITIPSYLRSAYRAGDNSSNRADTLGIRLVQAP